MRWTQGILISCIIGLSITANRANQQSKRLKKKDKNLTSRLRSPLLILRSFEDAIAAHQRYEGPAHGFASGAR